MPHAHLKPVHPPYIESWLTPPPGGGKEMRKNCQLWGKNHSLTPNIAPAKTFQPILPFLANLCTSKKPLLSTCLRKMKSSMGEGGAGLGIRLGQSDANVNITIYIELIISNKGHHRICSVTIVTITITITIFDAHYILICSPAGYTRWHKNACQHFRTELLMWHTCGGNGDYRLDL